MGACLNFVENKGLGCIVISCGGETVLLSLSLAHEVFALLRELSEFEDWFASIYDCSWSHCLESGMCLDLDALMNPAEQGLLRQRIELAKRSLPGSLPPEQRSRLVNAMKRIKSILYA